MVSLRALAAAVLPSAIALRLTSEAPKYRQELGNLQDMQYFGEMNIGGQPLTAILDTGSFELLVFSKSCPTCGIASKYNEQASGTFKWGKVTKIHAYGSGSCQAKDGYDTVTVGTVSAQNQPIWVATNCNIPLLVQASFNAIAGLGPPGQPAYTAESDVKMLEQMEQQIKSRNETVPDELTKQKEELKAVYEAAKTKHELLDTMGVTTFSTCLGRKPNSPGYLIWNDETRKGQPGVKQIPVAGNITWGVDVKNFSFHGQHKDDTHIGCGAGCGAVVDTGTSLIAVPTPMFQIIATQIQSLGLDCSDLTKFPDLTMDVGGQHIRFPPSAYLGNYVGQMNAQVEKFIRLDRIGETGVPCQLLLMDIGPPQQTSLGPMMILGMPFFREYYTTFDLTGGRGHRSIFVSPANENCEPDVTGVVSSDRSTRSLRYMPRVVNASVLRVPDWLRSGRVAGVKNL